ncbi:MAG: ABC transporter ATP-binding protein [Eubacteriales bacterium]|nr:ABC transporter ATP-binding protein [Eubacteriales bacterium]
MNRRLFQSIREYKKESVLTPVLVLLEVLMEVLIPLQMAKIIDNGIQGGDLAYIIEMGAILAVMAMLALFFGAMAGRMGSYAAAGYAKNLRHDIFYRIQEFSFKNIDHFSTSGLVTRLTTDITNVQMAYMMTLRLLARAPIMIVLSWIMTLTIDNEIALLFLVAIPILGGALLIIAKKAHPLFEQVFDEYDELNNGVQENVNASRVVKAYVREDFEIGKFHKISGHVYELFTKAERIVAWNSPIMQFTIYAVVLMIVLLGGKDIIRGKMEAGELTSILVYAIQILSSLMMVSFVFVMNMIAEASSDRILEVLSEEPEMQDETGAVKEVPDGSIDFDNVDFSYAGEDGALALKNVNLHIGSGQTIGIFGGTGSAKSTLVQLIPRLYDVTKGSVRVGGIDVRKYELKALRDQVSMVLQKNVLFTGSIYENIRWGDEHATDEEVQRVCALAQADGFIREFPDGYETQIVEGGNNVSGGQKQRLCIARALLKKPKILILDDSTSAVDTRTDALIRKAFREEIPDTTKIIISQRVSSIEDADQIIILDNGRIDGIGTSEELLRTNEIYREVYESQTSQAGDAEEADAREENAKPENTKPEHAEEGGNGDER